MMIKPNPEYVNAPYELGYFWSKPDSRCHPLPDYVEDLEAAGYKIVPQCLPHRYRSWSDYDPKDPAKNSIPPVILDEEGEE